MSSHVNDSVAVPRGARWLTSSLRLEISGAIGSPAIAMSAPITSGLDAPASGRQARGNTTAITTKVSARLRVGRRAPKTSPPIPLAADHTASRIPASAALPCSWLKAGRATSTVPMQNPTGKVVRAISRIAGWVRGPRNPWGAS